MDKETQDKIADLIEIGRANNHFPSYTARKIIEELNKPKEKPPLLRDDQIMKLYIQDSEFGTGRRCAKAQREADIKFYEG